jgi:hypothetical protein
VYYSIEIVKLPIEITCYESINTVTLKRRGKYYDQKSRKSGGRARSSHT